ncbi:Probable endopeptidase Spr precursor [Kingella potus]|uniref:Probable endopeptidase Spr n=1 Tax=Kingella potus TaxID=265175 RepID=A0A377R1S6_9NEIS|nr:C40 family peptidase [Kingella potus]STR02830.1 Probable endopeptidase Spr precursor [Kingella potus]
MKNTALLFVPAALLLAACGTPPKKHPRTHDTRTHTARAPMPKTIRISHIGRAAGGQELMLHSMDLVGTPYRWGGSSDTGFDCSGMVQYVYKNAIGINLPRSSRDMAAASRTISTRELQSGDLVFFNTSGRGISHVGLYLGGGKFLHAPRSGSTVQTESLSSPYYAKRLVKAGTFF